MAARCRGWVIVGGGQAGRFSWTGTGRILRGIFNFDLVVYLCFKVGGKRLEDRRNVLMPVLISKSRNFTSITSQRHDTSACVGVDVQPLHGAANRKFDYAESARTFENGQSSRVFRVAYRAPRFIEHTEPLRKHQLRRWKHL